MYLYYLLLIFALGLKTSASFSTPSYEINPVTIIKKDQNLVVGYFQGCGATFDGFVIQPYNDILTIGVLFQKDNLVCARMGRYVMRTLPLIHAQSFESYYSFRTHELLGKFRTVAFSKVNVSNSSKGGRVDIQAAYQSKCGTPVGFILRPNQLLKPNNAYSIGLIEHVGMSQPKCSFEPETANLNGILPVGGTVKLATNNAYKSSPTNHYITRLAELKPKSLLLNRTTGAISFQYKRRCHEAPIGTVQFVDEHTKSLQIGMVVAHYPDLVCASNTPSVTWSRYDTHVLKSPGSLKIRFRQPQNNNVLVDILPPYAVEGDQRYNRFAHFYKSCGKILGTIAVEQGERLYLGLVHTTIRSKVAKCNKQLGSYSMDLSGFSVANRAILPLRLKDSF